jgi:hypothetical protein
MGRCGAVVLAALAALAGGCTTNKDNTGQARHADVPGMMCPKCETVWVGPHVRGQGGKVQAYHWGREMVCPDCEAMAQSYFENGEQVLHECPSCKVTPKPVTPITPSMPKGPRT